MKDTYSAFHLISFTLFTPQDFAFSSGRVPACPVCKQMHYMHLYGVCVAFSMKAVSNASCLLICTTILSSRGSGEIWIKYIPALNIFVISKIACIFPVVIPCKKRFLSIKLLETNDLLSVL